MFSKLRRKKGSFSSCGRIVSARLCRSVPLSIEFASFTREMRSGLCGGYASFHEKNLGSDTPASMQGTRRESFFFSSLDSLPLPPLDCLERSVEWASALRSIFATKTPHLKSFPSQLPDLSLLVNARKNIQRFALGKYDRAVFQKKLVISFWQHSCIFPNENEDCLNSQNELLHFPRHLFTKLRHKF